MDKRMRTGALAGVVICMVCAANAFTLVENGKAAPVVLPAGAEESSKLAAVEWTNYVFKATGAAPEVLRAARWSAPTKDGAVGGDHRAPRAEGGAVGGDHRAPRAEGGAVGGDHRAPRVIIGTLATLKDVPQAIKAKLAEAKSCEASVTAEVDGNFWIVGKEEVGELYGVYKTLEDQLGIRWFKAWEKDDPGDYIPKKVGGESRWTLDGKFWFRAPYFEKRRLDMTGSSTAYIPYKGVEWVYRAGLQAWPQGGGGLSCAQLFKGPRPGPKARSKDRELWDFYKPRTQLRLLSIGGGHMMFVEPIRAKDYFKDHPEYFAEVNGKRVPGERYCLSNPEVQHLVAQHIIKVLRVTGGKGEYLFGLMDGRSGICECKNCQALDDEGAKSRELNSDISSRFVKIVKNIEAEVYREFPETDALTDWAYSIYGRTPPKDVKLDRRTGGQLCVTGRCYGHALDDPKCPINTERYAWVKGWMNVLSHAYTYEYSNCSDNFYTPYEFTLAHDLKLYKRLGLTGWKEEMCFTDSTPPSRFPKDPERIRRRSEKAPSNWQWFYLASRLTWDPDLDPQAVLDEIESKYYGEAFPAMKKYHALRRKIWNENKICMGWPRGNGRQPALLNKEGAKEELLALLGEADKLATEPITKVRLAKDRRWLTLYWIEPNEKLRAKAGKALTMPRTAKAPVIDADPSDACWANACRTTDFFETWNKTGAEVPPKPEYATSASVIADEKNIYVLLEAKEPSPDKLKAKHLDGGAVYEDDSFEVMFFPPSEANTYFQFCINTKGALTCYEQQMGRKRDDIAVEKAVKVGKDRYVIEMKIPVKNIYPLVKGDSWQFFVSRNRMVRDANSPKDMTWSIDACKVNNPTDWRAIRIQ